MSRPLCASIATAIRLSSVRLLTVATSSRSPRPPTPRQATSTAASPTAAGRRTCPRRGGYVAGLALLDGRRPLLSVASDQGGQPAPAALTLTAGGRLASRTAFPGLRRAALRRRLRAQPRRLRPHALPADADRRARRRGRSRSRTVIDGRPLSLEAGGWGVDREGRALVTVTYSRTTIALRYLPDGRLDPSYGRDGIARVGNVTAYPALVRRDGRLYVLAGDDRRDTQVIALDARGRRVAGFRTRTLMSGRFAQLPQPVGHHRRPGWPCARRRRRPVPQRLGRAARRRRACRPALRRPRAGARSPDFTANRIVRDRRGRIVVAGSAEAARGSFQAAVTRLSARGRLDRRFGIVSKRLGALRGVNLVASQARHVAVDDRGRIVIAGEVYDDDYELRDDLGKSYPAIARLHG